jgi:hypothetical protein
MCRFTPRLQTRSLRPLLFTVLLILLACPIFAQVAITVSFGPPPLPVYEQPLCPAEGYIWTPGYWAWDPDYGYYWVPGTWVLAPEVGYLWTPPWWGWENGAYLFHAGYWGPGVGFYGGINYGFGYFGHGFEGGRWQGNRFFYNRSVVNVNVVNIHNVYNETVVNRGVENRVSYNGGQGGITARPTAQEEAAGRERHLPPITVQTQHREQARTNPELRARTNMGKPPIAATEKPASFSGHVVPARAAGGTWHPPANAPGNRPAANAGESRANANPAENRPAGNASHARDLQPHAVTTRPSSGNTQADQKYQQQQEKLTQKQNQEHQKLAQRQQKEDQRAQRQNYAQPRQQQMEQHHQQQTQQMEQRHMQQTQQMQERQMGRPGGRPH